MEYLNDTLRQKINKKIKRNRVIDAIIFFFSCKKSIYEKLQFKFWLFTKKTDYKSSFDPIVIGGCPRSGTTLLRAFIGMHPDIAAPKQEYNLIIGKKNDEILKNVLGFSSSEISKLKKPWKNIIYFSERILKYYTNKEGKKKIVLKQPFHILYIDELFHFFPNMKFIHLIRDGRDVASSYRTHPKWKIVDGKILLSNNKNPLKWCIRRWIVCINCGIYWRKSKNYIEIKYEDLVNSTEETMNKIFDFLELKMISKEKLLNFYKFEKNEDHLQNIEVGKALYRKSIGRHKKDMSKLEKQMFNRMSGDLLIELGYKDTAR